jgi:hypothetical protein
VRLQHGHAPANGYKQPNSGLKNDASLRQMKTNCPVTASAVVVQTFVGAVLGFLPIVSEIDINKNNSSCNQ